MKGTGIPWGVWAKWRPRLLFAVGVLVLCAGVGYIASAPLPSGHYHDNPSQGDLGIGGGVYLLGLGVVLIISGWWYKSRDG